MASPYTGNPTGVQAPGTQPMPGVLPIVSIPAGTDVRTIESITQEMKECADFIAYIQNHLVSADFVCLHENWIGKTTGNLTSASPVANFLQWTINSSGTAVGAAMGGTVSPGVTGYSGPAAVLNPGTTNVSYTSIATAGQMLYVPLANPTAWIFETVVLPIMSGAWKMAIGISSTQTPLESGTTDTNFMFTASNSAANYKIQTQNGIAANTTVADSGVAWSTSTAAKLRAIYTSGQVQFYINGSSVGTITTNLPAFSGSGLGFFFAATAASLDTTATRSFYVGQTHAIMMK